MFCIEHLLSDLPQSFSAVQANCNVIAPQMRSRYLSLSFIFSDWVSQMCLVGKWQSRKCSLRCAGSGSRKVQGARASLGELLGFQRTLLTVSFSPLSLCCLSHACYSLFLML